MVYSRCVCKALLVLIWCGFAPGEVVKSFLRDYGILRKPKAHPDSSSKWLVAADVSSGVIQLSFFQRWKYNPFLTAKACHTLWFSLLGKSKPGTASSTYSREEERMQLISLDFKPKSTSEALRVGGFLIAWFNSVYLQIRFLLKHF